MRLGLGGTTLWSTENDGIDGSTIGQTIRGEAFCWILRLLVKLFPVWVGVSASQTLTSVCDPKEDAPNNNHIRHDKRPYILPSPKDGSLKKLYECREKGVVEWTDGNNHRATRKVTQKERQPRSTVEPLSTQTFAKREEIMKGTPN